MPDLFHRLAARLGERYVSWGEGGTSHGPVVHLGSTNGAEPSLLVRPADAAEVSAVLRLAAAERWPVVPVGGRTGTVGGVDTPERSVLLSLERLNRIEEIDESAMTVTVGAGVILQTLQEQLEARQLLLPIDIGARGSATVGGVVATNAGGLRAIKWGVTRDQVLGLEVVLADGTIVDGLRKLLKNNAGYDWQHLMIGSEGTLGVVTRVVFRLQPVTAPPATAMLALADFPSVLALLRRIDAETGGRLTSFELSWREIYDLVTLSPAWNHVAPLAPGYPFYALVEIDSGEARPDETDELLGRLIDEGLILDGTVARSNRQRQDMWATRDDMSPLAAVGPIFAYDVSVPIGRMGELEQAVRADVGSEMPDAQLFTFGHAGDGNLHFVIAPGQGRAGQAERADAIVYRNTGAMRGSIAAEHGIGRYRRDAIGYTRNAQELALMRRLKHALDPSGLLNPGKVLPEAVA